MTRKQLPNKKLLKILRNELPAGFATEVQERLPKGFKFSKTYIYRVLSPEHKAYNQHIINAAIKYVEELTLLRQQQEIKVRRLVSKS